MSGRGLDRVMALVSGKALGLEQSTSIEASLVMDDLSSETHYTRYCDIFK